ncbi:MAG: SHOCT domain-containing protein [Hamadaea sp.]|nr:SHOCT domain-containing protein [Hamadaea sp.]NUR50168.1 SHOCT domain-containing protein [Hamadaea sp.]NUT03855.1 SHOCT domain-containing protein [Hamadaea sp.]
MMGLLRGVARTAVVAGTATAVSNRVSRRQAGRWAAQEQQQQYEYAQQEAATQAQQPPPAAAPDKLEQLKTLGELKAQGVLTDSEFEQQKQRILAG